MPRPSSVEPTTAYRLLKRFGAPLLRAAFRLRAEGAGNVPASGPCILAANHLSYLDPLVLAATCPRPVLFMMTRRFWEMPFVGWVSRSAGSFPIDPERISPGTFKAALGVLRAGGVLGIFPEGGISPDGTLQAVKPGVARIALGTGCPVVPAGIVGTRRAFPKGRLLPRLTPVLVRYGEPIVPEASPDPPGPAAVAALTALLGGRIAALAADPGP